MSTINFEPSVVDRDRNPISIAAMSEWGRRVTLLRGRFDLSYRDIARESGITNHATIYRMATEPNFEPRYSVGLKFLSFFERITGAVAHS